MFIVIEQLIRPLLLSHERNEFSKCWSRKYWSLL